MDFEAHSVTLISIIVGLGLTEMFSNLHRLIRNRGRVGWDALPIAWAAMMFLLVVNYWWALYLRLDGSQQARTAADFALILAPAILLFLTTASVLPNFESGGDWDMQTHYREQRGLWILTFALYQVSTWATSMVTGALAWNYVTLIRGVILVLLISMLFVKARRWDWFVVIAITAFLLIRLCTQVVR